MGHTLEYKGYVCYNLETKKMVVSRHVIFHEDVFPFANPCTFVAPSSDVFTPSASVGPNPAVITTLFPSFTSTGPPTVHLPMAPSGTSNGCSSTPVTACRVTDTSLVVPNNISQPTVADISVGPNTDTCLVANPIVDTVPGASNGCSSSGFLPTNQPSMVTRSKSGIFKKKVFNTSSCAPILSEPTSFTATSKIPKWKQAMVDEFSALQSQHTWSLVLPVDNMNIVGCKWVFRTKYN
ncbi:MAG: hypothetical protein Q8835_02885, partial [Sweet potato little leaf phytoplasma]|nr:hypothetical protein [Sweet potato little leaf phytoplasma]